MSAIDDVQLVLHFTRPVIYCESVSTVMPLHLLHLLLLLLLSTDKVLTRTQHTRPRSTFQCKVWRSCEKKSYLLRFNEQTAELSLIVSSEWWTRPRVTRAMKVISPGYLIAFSSWTSLCVCCFLFLLSFYSITDTQKIVLIFVSIASFFLLSLALAN